MLGLCEVTTCRRQVLLHHFGETLAEPCGNCDTCLEPVETWDATEAARMALSVAQPPGYPVAARSHNAVAAAIAQHRADWGVAIEWTAKRNGLSFLPLTDEQFDFIIPTSRRERPAVRAFRQALKESDVQQRLSEYGFTMR